MTVSDDARLFVEVDKLSREALCAWLSVWEGRERNIYFDEDLPKLTRRFRSATRSASVTWKPALRAIFAYLLRYYFSKLRGC